MSTTKEEYTKQLKKELKLENKVDIHFNSKGVLIIELNKSSEINPQLKKFKSEYEGPLDIIVHR